MADVILKNVQKSFGKAKVIHGVDLEIRDGEFVVFVGPSGCGKSTLLRLVAGLEDITHGDIYIDGGCAKRRGCSRSTISSTASRSSSRAGNASASPSDGPSCAIRRSSCSTSPC